MGTGVRVAVEEAVGVTVIVTAALVRLRRRTAMMEPVRPNCRPPRMVGAISIGDIFGKLGGRSKTRKLTVAESHGVQARAMAVQRLSIGRSKPTLLHCRKAVSACSSSASAPMFQTI